MKQIFLTFINNVQLMKSKPALITLEDEDGNIIKRIPMTEADDDWIRAARLKR